MGLEQRQHQYSNESSIAALNEKTNIGRVYVPPSKRLQQGQQQQNEQPPSGITNIPPPRKLKQFPASFVIKVICICVQVYKLVSRD